MQQEVEGSDDVGFSQLPNGYRQKCQNFRKRSWPRQESGDPVEGALPYCVGHGSARGITPSVPYSSLGNFFLVNELPPPSCSLCVNAASASTRLLLTFPQWILCVEGIPSQRFVHGRREWPYIILFIFYFIFLNLNWSYAYWFERERKRNLDVREKLQSIAYLTYPKQGLNTQPFFFFNFYFIVV